MSDLYQTRETLLSQLRELAASAAIRIAPASAVEPPTGFGWPSGIAVDLDGNVFVADMENHCIFKASSDGRLMLVAGDGQPGYLDAQAGCATAARFNGPVAVAVGRDDVLFVSDAVNGAVRRIAPDGSVTTLLGNQMEKADERTASRQPTVASPSGIVLDHEGTLFVADLETGALLRVAPSGDTSYVVSGPTSFEFPIGLAINGDGDLLVTEGGYHRVCRVMSSGAIHVVAGGDDVNGGYVDALGEDARFDSPHGMAVDLERNVYVADLCNSCVRRISSSGVVSTFAGRKEDPTTNEISDRLIKLELPTDVAIDIAGRVYISDGRGRCVHIISPDGAVSKIA